MQLDSLYMYRTIHMNGLDGFAACLTHVKYFECVHLCGSICDS
jgi:hypothetical protein